MSLFDSTLEKVWQIARKGQQDNDGMSEDLLTKMSALRSDKAKIEAILTLTPLQQLQVTDGFSQKSESVAEELRLQGDQLCEENTKEALQLYASAIRLAPSGSSTLARCYSSRCRILYSQGATDEAVQDANRAIAVDSLNTQEKIRLLILTASCHGDQRDWEAAESKLNEALESVRTSKDINNEIKAQLATELSSQLKEINRRQTEAKAKPKRGGKKSTKPGTQSQANMLPTAEGLPELAFGKNAKFPAASCALQLGKSKEKGYYMTASRNIKLGQRISTKPLDAVYTGRPKLANFHTGRGSLHKGQITRIGDSIQSCSVLIVERPYAWSLTREAMAEHCLQCCRRAPTPVPCTHCSTVVFCGEICREEAWNKYHQYECNVLDHILNSKELSGMALLVFRLAITALSVKEDTDIFLNEEEQQHPFPVPLESEAYASVHRQVTNSHARTPADLLKRAVSAVFLARCLAHTSFPLSDEVIAAAMMFRHLQSCSCNAYQITEQRIPGGDVRGAEGVEIGGAVYPTVSLCNHGCYPNVVRHSLGKLCIVRAIRAIKKGEEILDNYGPHFLAEPLPERQRFLQTQYFFKCECDACVNSWPIVRELQTQASHFKCMHCASPIGSEVSTIKSCPKCKKKLDYSRVFKRLRALEGEYKTALDHLINRRLEKCLKICFDYAETLEAVVMHPNKDFVKCQQAITLCWNLMGNTVEK